MIFFRNSHQQHLLNKKAKKKALQRKNQIHMSLFAFARQRLADDKKKRDLKELADKERKKALSREEQKRADKKEIWSVKVATIRNRLSDKKRTSDERWNRFSASEEGGGRAR